MKNRAAKMQFLPMVGIAFLQFKADATTFLKHFHTFPLDVLKRDCGLISKNQYLSHFHSG